ncbi:type 1 glutamine amidotransferase family protein [Aidingimonas lacisalsi]|uniref:hypothetical protein n=1 Tax=Aidingimonas lacisalsi TaxID=2604086 RepID=UPI001F17FDBE|nr:hypothetical protein [Aidingimonas lacisalsi]
MAVPTSSRRRAPLPERIGILLMPQFSFGGLGAILDPLFIINWLAQEPRFTWQLLGSDASVSASNGIPMSDANVGATPSNSAPRPNIRSRHRLSFAR